MIDVKELKTPNNIYIEEFDVKVRPYLTVDEIMDIGETLLLAENTVVQQALLMTSVFNVCTDIPKEYIMQPTDEDDEPNEDFMGYDLMIQSGLWGAVANILSDSIDQIWEYVNDKEDASKAVSRFINNDLTSLIERVMELLTKWEKKMPRGKQWTQMLENFPQRLANAIVSINEDGNAEIIKNALELNTVNKDATDK